MPDTTASSFKNRCRGCSQAYTGDEEEEDGDYSSHRREIRSLSMRYLAMVFVVSRSRRVSRIFFACLVVSVPLSTAFCNPVTTQRACSFLKSLPNVRAKSASVFQVRKFSIAVSRGLCSRLTPSVSRVIIRD